MVDNTTINGIVTHFFHDKDAAYLQRQIADELTPTELGEMLYRLNLAVVEDRYVEYATGTMCDLDYQFHSVIVSKVQVIKSLSCWLYQCSEGTIDEDPLFKIMEKYKSDLAMDFVRALPEWETANWS